VEDRILDSVFGGRSVQLFLLLVRFGSSRKYAMLDQYCLWHSNGGSCKGQSFLGGMVCQAGSI
jgi:hypothetical protein